MILKNLVTNGQTKQVKNNQLVSNQISLLRYIFKEIVIVFQTLTILFILNVIDI